VLLQRRHYCAIFAFLIYLGLSFLWFHNAFFHQQNKVIGVCPDFGCDSSQFVWGESWIAYSIFHLKDPLFTNYIYYPAGVNAMWQTWAILIALILSPLHFVLNPLQTYNLGVVFSQSLNCFFTYIAFRKWIGGYIAPFFGALIFGFSAYFAGQWLGHENLAAAFFVPLILLSFSHVAIYMKFKPHVSGVLLGLALAGQFYVSQEVLVSALMFLFIFFILSFIFNYSSIDVYKRKYFFKAVGIALIVFVILVAYPVYYQINGPQKLVGSIHPLFNFDVTEIIFPQQVSLKNILSFKSAALLFLPKFNRHFYSENDYIGITAIILCAISLYKNHKKPGYKEASILGVVALLLACGPKLMVNNHVYNVPLLWSLFDHIPFVKLLFTVRFALYAQFAAAFLIAGLIAEVMKIEFIFKRAFYFLAVLFLCSSNISLFSFETYGISTPQFFSQAAYFKTYIKPGEAGLIMPYPRSSPYNVGPMFWQASDDFYFKIMGGYALVPSKGGKFLAAGGWPPTGLELQIEQILSNNRYPILGYPPPAKVAKASDLKWIRAQHIGFVILSPMKREKEALRYIKTILGNPSYVGGIYFWKIDKS
jgi:hypothetical protein